jgi:transcriptional regulator with XRE-family HTH domain
METIEVEVTKLHKILIQRGMTQKDFRTLIQETNNGYAPSIYILNEMINGKRLNYNISTLRQIKKALNVSYDELIEG